MGVVYPPLTFRIYLAMAFGLDAERLRRTLQLVD
jgi:hypothetical protein